MVEHNLSHFHMRHINNRLSQTTKTRPKTKTGYPSSKKGSTYGDCNTCTIVLAEFTMTKRNCDFKKENGNQNSCTEELCCTEELLYIYAQSAKFSLELDDDV